MPASLKLRGVSHGLPRKSRRSGATSPPQFLSAPIGVVGGSESSELWSGPARIAHGPPASCRGGRPAALDESKIRAAKAMLASGSMSAIEVAQQLGCAPSTLYRHLPGGRTAVAESGMPAAD